ncbi:ABC transporter ATP-binding protein [Streptomyces sp. NPDC055400]
MPAKPLLEVRGLSVAYGPALVLSDVDLTASAGAAVAVLGTNGAGKSSLGKAVCALVPTAAGSIRFRGEDIRGRSPSAVSAGGLAYLPEGRGIFRGLSVQDNLRMFFGVRGRSSPAVEAAYERFPRLAERRRQTAGTLSGGEQQILALARVVAGQPAPALIVADEPSLGLAPALIDTVFEALDSARAAGAAIVLIEQYVTRALEFADSAVVLRKGVAVWSGTATDAGAAVAESYLDGAGTPVAGGE